MFSLWYFWLHSHWSPRFGCAVYVLNYVFQNRNRAAQIDGFIWEYCGYPVKAKRKWRHLFVWILILILIQPNLFVIRYLLTEDCGKASKLSVFISHLRNYIHNSRNIRVWVVILLKVMYFIPRIGLKIWNIHRQVCTDIY